MATTVCSPVLRDGAHLSFTTKFWEPSTDTKLQLNVNIGRLLGLEHAGTGLDGLGAWGIDYID